MSNIACMIPVYNNADTLERCIKSVYNDVEVIIVVDGIFTGGWSHYLGPKKVKNNFSTDNTYEICRKYGVKTWYRQTIGPPGTKLNAWLSLIPKSCGWILQMDADEVMSSNGVKNLKKFLVSEEGKKYGNFSIRFYNLYGGFTKYLDTSYILKEPPPIWWLYNYCVRVHYYRTGFYFNDTSEWMFTESGVIYKPCEKHNKQGDAYSYCIPESVCKIAHLHFLRKDIYQGNRLLNSSADGVTIGFGGYSRVCKICDFDVKEFVVLC